MAQAEFVHGNPLMVDHTPTGAVTNGDVIVMQDSIRIAHLDITATKLGALAAGGAVYKLNKNTSQAMTDGEILYWNDTANELTTTASTHKKFGVAAQTKLAADTAIWAQHIPNS